MSEQQQINYLLTKLLELPNKIRKAGKKNRRYALALQEQEKTLNKQLDNLLPF